MFDVANQFSKSTVSILAKKQITIIAPSGFGENGQHAYLINDKGMGKVRTYLEILAIAKGK